jgi:hypothetical protein
MGKTTDISIKKDQWTHPEYNSGIKSRGSTQHVLETVDRTRIDLQGNSDWTFGKSGHFPRERPYESQKYKGACDTWK